MAARATAIEDVPSPHFPHPYLAVDVLLLTVRQGQLQVLVIERTEEAPLGWALPGAFVQLNEPVEETANRVLREKLGYREAPRLLALRPFGDVDRDPRRRVISLPHLALIDFERFGHGPPTTGGAIRAATVRLDEALETSIDGRRERLVFDHERMLTEGIWELRRRVRLDDPEVPAQLLPPTFTLRELQEVHEVILGTKLNKDSFRRRTLAREVVAKTGGHETNVEHRPAALWRWR